MKWFKVLFILIPAVLIGIVYSWFRAPKLRTVASPVTVNAMGRLDPDSPSGIISVSVASKLLGQSATLAEVKNLMQTDDRGQSTAEELVDAINKLNLSASVFQYQEIPSLSRDECLIVQLGDNHWAVVAEGLSGTLLFDPPNMPVDFHSRASTWDGVGILVRKNVSR